MKHDPQDIELLVVTESDGRVIGATLAAPEGSVRADDVGIVPEAGQRIEKIKMPARHSRILENPDQFFRWVADELEPSRRGSGKHAARSEDPKAHRADKRSRGR